MNAGAKGLAFHVTPARPLTRKERIRVRALQDRAVWLEKTGRGGRAALERSALRWALTVLGHPIPGAVTVPPAIEGKTEA